MEATDLFVFAGAGASFSPPCSFPLFRHLRDALLHDLELQQYLPDPNGHPADFAGPGNSLHRVAEGLIPEPFMQAVEDAGVPVSAWLAEAFAAPTPNAVHSVLAQLAAGGAKVWTVNFDTAIETAAGGTLTVSAWPEAPARDAQLLKAHGTVGSDLILTAKNLLRGLDENWREQLAEDVAGRTVVFIGYSANDLDFQPVWRSILPLAHRVIWFDRPEQSNLDRERDRKRGLLRDVPIGKARFEEAVNPSRAFVDWAANQGLATVPPDLDTQLDANHDAGMAALPPVPNAHGRARASVLQLLGDRATARGIYLKQIVSGPERYPSARALASLTANHGSRPTAEALRSWVAVPAMGRLRDIRAAMRRKRISILFNLGRHEDVLRATRNQRHSDPSTLQILRGGSLRMMGRLDEAEGVLADALARARSEGHDTRASNAAFQLGFTRMWRGDTPGSRVVLDEHLRPLAEITGNRWMGWADFLEGALSIHDCDVEGARSAINLGQMRFEAEGLLDGLVDVLMLRLTHARLEDAENVFLSVWDEIQKIADGPAATYYSERHPFRQQALAIELGEFVRCGGAYDDDPEQLFAVAAASEYPFQSACGLLGLAALHIEAGPDAAAIACLERAETVARTIGARGLLVRASDLSNWRQACPGKRPPQWFNP